MGPFVMAKGMTDGGDGCWSQAFVPKTDFGNTHEGSAFCALLQKVITSLVFTVNLKSPVLSDQVFIIVLLLINILTW